MHSMDKSSGPIYYTYSSYLAVETCPMKLLVHRFCVDVNTEEVGNCIY